MIRVLGRFSLFIEDLTNASKVIECEDAFLDDDLLRLLHDSASIPRILTIECFNTL